MSLNNKGECLAIGPTVVLEKCSAKEVHELFCEKEKKLIEFGTPRHSLVHELGHFLHIGTTYYGANLFHTQASKLLEFIQFAPLLAKNAKGHKGPLRQVIHDMRDNLNANEHGMLFTWYELLENSYLSCSELGSIENQFLFDTITSFYRHPTTPLSLSRDLGDMFRLLLESPEKNDEPPDYEASDEARRVNTASVVEGYARLWDVFSILVYNDPDSASLNNKTCEQIIDFFLTNESQHEYASAVLYAYNSLKDHYDIKSLLVILFAIFENSLMILPLMYYQQLFSIAGRPQVEFDVRKKFLTLCEQCKINKNTLEKNIPSFSLGNSYVDFVSYKTGILRYSTYCFHKNFALYHISLNINKIFSSLFYHTSAMLCMMKSRKINIQQYDVNSLIQDINIHNIPFMAICSDGCIFKGNLPHDAYKDNNPMFQAMWYVILHVAMESLLCGEGLHKAANYFSRAYGDHLLDQFWENIDRIGWSDFL